MIARLAAPLALALAALLGGCDQDIALPSGEVALRPMGGILYDTNSIGGFNFSELTFVGSDRSIRHRRICLGQKYLFRCLDKVVVVNGRLRGVIGGQIYAGDDFIDARWELDADPPEPDHPEGDGVYDSSMTVVFKGRRLVPTAAGDLELFDLQIDRESVTGPLKALLPDGTGPVPYCAPDPARGDATEATLLANTHIDHDDGSVVAEAGTLHLACSGGATGRAALLGYHPGTIGTAGYEAALRALRADYCGDGHSHATVGDPFQIADTWGLHASEGPIPEARWTDAGALCLDAARSPSVDADALRQSCGIPKCDGVSEGMLWTSRAK
ncbi:MAG: ADYC domain-containing protein [Nannocystaceae bacterium]